VSNVPLPLRDAVRPTTWIESTRLSRRLGANVTIASETFQRTGSFKFRAAYNVAASVPQLRIITASSGNFGQALACACQLLDKSCTIVMPETSARVKVNAVREFGGVVDLIDVTKITRKARVEQLASKDPDAFVASAYDHPLVIEGSASLGVEIAERGQRFDCVLAPLGGGGLTAGVITGLRKSGNSVSVIAVEPVLANDGARSFRAGQLLANESEPQTVADGVRTISIGQHNWKILQKELADVIEVTEEHIIESTRLLFDHANLKAEPTGALAIAALLSAPDRFRGRNICCVISGGNVDPEVFFRIVATH
jgi:threonine dehydratase